MLISALLELIVLTVPPAAVAVAEIPASIQALKVSLGKSVEFQSTPTPIVQYCPDNTCEVFASSRKAAGTDVADFALLYLWYVSDYAVLGTWRNTGKPTAITSALARHADACGDGSETARVKCALHKLADRSLIRLSLVRFDENARVETAVNFDDALSRTKER